MPGWLDGRSLFNVLGFEFTLLRLDGAADIQSLAGAAATLKLSLTVADLSGESLRDLYEADLALILPDQVVAWRGDALPEDPRALLETVTAYRP